MLTNLEIFFGGVSVVLLVFLILFYHAANEQADELAAQCQKALNQCGVDELRIMLKQANSLVNDNATLCVDKYVFENQQED